MKIIAYILALTILGLSVYSCSDDSHCDEDKKMTSHNHSEDEKDDCSPFCICACCGSTYMKSEVRIIEQIAEQTDFNFNFHYSFHYSFSYQLTVWHPPSCC